MIKSGYTGNVWSAALKTAYRFKKLTTMPNRYEKRVWKFIKKDGSERVINGVYSEFVNTTTIRMKDLDDGRGKWKSFRIWQLLPTEDQAII